MSVFVHEWVAHCDCESCTGQVASCTCMRTMRVPCVYLGRDDRPDHAVVPYPLAILGDCYIGGDSKACLFNPSPYFFYYKDNARRFVVFPQLLPPDSSTRAIHEFLSTGGAVRSCLEKQSSSHLTREYWAPYLP